MKNVIKLINSNPRFAKQALENVYHGKVFALVSNGERIDSFYKTKRGAEGYIKKQQRVSYYDDYSQQMVTCGAGLEVFQIQATDIIDPISNIQPWYNHIKSLYSRDWYVRDIIQLAKYYEVSAEVMEYVEKAVNEALTEFSFTHIDKYETPEVSENVQENEVTEAITSDSITVTIEENEKGIELYFSGVPSENVRNELKANKFKWNGKKKCWYAYKNDTVIAFAEALQSILNSQLINNEEMNEVDQPETTNEPITENESNHQTTYNSDGKIQIKSITFPFSENRYIRSNTTVNTMEEAENIIFHAACAFEGVGYDKTDFIITWTDGQTYKGRIDIDKNTNNSGTPLKSHIIEHCTFYNGTRKPSHMTQSQYNKYLETYSTEEKQEYTDFLNTYALEDNQPENKPKKTISPLWTEETATASEENTTSNVLDITAKLKAKQDETLKADFKKHFINDFIKTLSFEDQTKLADIAYQDNDNFNKVITEMYLSYQVEKALNKI